jgi:hypothetical protein
MRAICFTSSLIIALIFTAASAQAQVSYGVKAGVGISTVSLSDQISEAFTVDGRFGMHGGIFVNYGFGGKFAAQLDLLYSQKGGTLKARELTTVTLQDGTQVTGRIESEENLNYLDIPLVFQYRFRGRQLTPYVNAGPQFSFGIGGKSTLKLDSDTNPIQDPSQDINFGSANADDYKAFDFGFSLGAGAELELESGALVFDLRAGLGATNMDPQDRDAFNTKNRTFTFSVGYKFGRGGW